MLILKFSLSDLIDGYQAASINIVIPRKEVVHPDKKFDTDGNKVRMDSVSEFNNNLNIIF